MLKITGLDKLQRQLADARSALEALNGDLGDVSFDPHDPASLETAIGEMARRVDERVGAYADNPIVAPVAAELKERTRTAILERAAAARLQGEDD